jgi:diaminopimelate decarboxylase
MLIEEVEIAKKISEKYKLNIVGLQTYIGTNTLDEEIYLNSVRILTSLASQFPNLRYINLGGGFGVPYSDTDKEFSWNNFGKEISRLFNQIGREMQLKIEPGRSIVGNAGYFLTRVIELRDKDTLVVDSPYTNFARPFVYHTNMRVRCLRGSEPKKIFNIRGCSINSNDFLSKSEFDGDKAVLPEDIKEGELLCFYDSGAYSPAMQLDFLHYGKAKTVVVENNQAKCFP